MKARKRFPKANVAREKIEQLALVDIIKQFDLHAVPTPAFGAGYPDVSYSLPTDLSEKNLTRLIETVGAATTSEKVLFSVPSTEPGCSNAMLLEAGKPLPSETASVAHLLGGLKKAGCWHMSPDYFSIEQSPLSFSDAVELAYSASLLLTEHVSVKILGPKDGMPTPATNGYSIHQGNGDASTSVTWLNTPKLVVTAAKALATANASGAIYQYGVSYGCLEVTWIGQADESFHPNMAPLKSIPNWKACR